MRSDPQAARFDREAWAQRANAVRERLAVSAVVGRVVALKKAGAELVGLCPFHAEKTPSFTVNDRKGFYHCFGCGEHGDAIAFVMRRQGHAFPQAVELLEAEGGLRHLQAARPNPPAPQVRAARGSRQGGQGGADLGAARSRSRSTARSTATCAAAACCRPPSMAFGDPAGSAGWPSTLRYAPELWHGLEKRRLPAMVSAMRRPDGTLGAVHRTYLKITGVGVTKAGTERDKAMFGDPKGTWILLAPIADDAGRRGHRDRLLRDAAVPARRPRLRRPRRHGGDRAAVRMQRFPLRRRPQQERIPIPSARGSASARRGPARRRSASGGRWR
jgi:hypothetical protein